MLKIKKVDESIDTLRNCTEAASPSLCSFRPEQVLAGGPD